MCVPRRSDAFSCTTADQIRSAFTRPPNRSSFSFTEPTFSLLLLTTSMCMTVFFINALLLTLRRLRRLLDLRLRLGLRRHRLADHDVAAGRPGHRALEDEQIVLGVDLQDAQIARRHAIAAHAAGGAHALHDARRKRRGADRSGRAMEHRPVRRRAAAEVVALDDALKALAAADADHVDAIAVREHAVDEHLIARLERLAAGLQLDLAPHAGRRHAGLLVVAVERLAHARGTLLDETELDRLVALGRRRLRL